MGYYIAIILPLVLALLGWNSYCYFPIADRQLDVPCSPLMARQTASGFSDAMLVLVEELIDSVIVCQGLDMSDGHLPLPPIAEVEQGTHRRERRV